MKILVLTLAVLLTISCSNDNKNAKIFTPQNITPILIGEGNLFSSFSNNTSANNLVILNDPDWNNFITNINNPNNLSMTFSETNIDFNNFMIVVIFDQPRPTDGYQVSITSITENNVNIVVDVNYVGSGGITQMPTHPYYIVKIPKSTKPVVFQ